MARNPTSRPASASRGLVLLVAALASACAGAAPLETATSMPDAERRPDGVVLEPPPAIPSPVDRAPAQGVVALREPLADRDVQEIVLAYVRAFVHERIDDLTDLLAQDAAPLDRAGGATQLVATWRAKMNGYEYQQLASTEVARLSELERLSYEELGAPGAPPRPRTMRPGDLWVRVPIAKGPAGTEPLFGDALILLLRREDGALKIAGQADE